MRREQLIGSIMGKTSHLQNEAKLKIFQGKHAEPSSKNYIRLLRPILKKFKLTLWPNPLEVGKISPERKTMPQIRLYICNPNEICVTSRRHNFRAWRRQPFKLTCVSVSDWQKGGYKTKSNHVRRLTHESPSPHVVRQWDVPRFIESLLKHLWSAPKSRHASPKMWHLSGQPWAHVLAPHSLARQSTGLVLALHPLGCPYAKLSVSHSSANPKLGCYTKLE